MVSAFHEHTLYGSPGLVYSEMFLNIVYIDEVSLSDELFSHGYSIADLQEISYCKLNKLQILDACDTFLHGTP